MAPGTEIPTVSVRPARGDEREEHHAQVCDRTDRTGCWRHDERAARRARGRLERGASRSRYDIQWIQSQVVDDKIYCLYAARARGSSSSTPGSVASPRQRAPGRGDHRPDDRGACSDDQGGDQSHHGARRPREGDGRSPRRRRRRGGRQDTVMFLTKESVRLWPRRVSALGTACDGCPPIAALMGRFRRLAARSSCAPSASTRG